MKAILVLNIPEDFDRRRFSMDGDGNIYYERKCERRTSIIGNIKNLKLIPQKRYSLECGDSDGNKWREPSEYDMGYNKCIDDILEDR